LTEDEEADPPVPLRRILWVGTLTVLASMAAVVVVQVLAVVQSVTPTMGKSTV